MKIKAGDRFRYEIKSLDGLDIDINFKKFVNGNKVKDNFRKSGVIIADNYNLLLVPNVPITKTGCLVTLQRI